MKPVFMKDVFSLGVGHMETSLMQVRLVCTGALFLALGMFAFIRGFQAWRNPENSWGLGISWYISLAKWMLPADERDKLEKQAFSPRIVRALAFMSMMGGGIAILGVIAMIFLS